ncbi:MAG: hypothetical protein Fur0040_07090 [Sideroxydans sp.]
MLEVRAIVISLHGEEADISPLDSGGCGRCNSAGGCGSGKLSRLFCSDRPRVFRVLNRAHAAVGDEVNVVLAEGSVWRGAWRLYLLPLLLMFGAAGLAASLAVTPAMRDGYAGVGALFGLLCGFLWARFAPGGSAPRAVVAAILARRSV